MTNEEFIESIRLDGEEWKDVVGYEGHYMVSSFGRIVSLGRYVRFYAHTKMIEPCIKQQHMGKNGYFSVTFKKNGNKKCVSVHRIVAIAFIPNPNNYPCIDHKNDNQTDNRACNLQWCTHKMNNSKEHHRIAESLSQRGKKLPSIRKPIVQLNTNGDLIQIFPSMTDADLSGFQHSAIHRVIHNKLKTHRGFKWMYLSDYEALVNQDVKERLPDASGD
jgi:hypothetical protein